MAWYVYVAWFFAGAFLANAIPHIVQGICGNRFQTPFASPRGVGESSAIVNVIWGFANFAIGGGLLQVFFPSELPPPWPLCIAALAGAAAMALWLASHFGKVRDAPPHPEIANISRCGLALQDRRQMSKMFFVSDRSI